MSTLIDSDSVSVVVNEVNTQVTVGVAGIQGPAGIGASATAGIAGISISGGDTITGIFSILAGNNVTLTQIGGNSLSISAATGSTASTSGFITTGDADSRYYPLNTNPNGYLTGFNSGQYINTGQTGQFYPYSNPNGYIGTGAADSRYSTISNLTNTGHVLDDKINSLSGYSNNSFATITNLQLTGANLQSQITSIRNGTGDFVTSSIINGYITTGQADTRYYSINNPNSYITNSGFITGFNSGQYITTGQTGQFYPASNPSQFSSSGNVAATGAALQSQINNIYGSNILYRTGEQGVTGYKSFNDRLSQGIGANASGEYSHAEGEDSLSVGYGAHAEGFGTIAYGDYSHSEGYQSVTSGEYSHAEGLEAIAIGDYQNVIGKYNLADSGALFIVGNGTSVSNRANILLIRDSGIVVEGSGNFDSLYFNGIPVITTNDTGQFYPQSNPFGFSNSGNLQSVSGELSNRIGQTGFSLNDRVNSLSGYGNSTFATIVNLTATGTTLFNLIQEERNKNTITGIQITGSNGITGIINIVGIYGTNVILSGANTIGISGGGSIESTVEVAHNFFFDYPFSGLNMIESYIQSNFFITGTIIGVNTTGNAGPIGLNWYQRLTDGTSKISLFNDTFETGIYHKVNSKTNIPVTGINRLVLDITGVISGFQGLSIGIFGYK